MTPARRLYVLSDALPPAPPAVVAEVVVWCQRRLAHCEEEREEQERRERMGEAEPPVQMLGGDAFCHGGGAFVLGTATNPESFALTYARTDRKRQPVPVASADVHHLYQIELSWAWAGPHRTLRPGGMWFDVLDHPELSPAAVRRLIYGGLSSHDLPRGPREATYRVLQDDWPAGLGLGECSGGCAGRAHGGSCVAGLCKLCTHMWAASGGAWPPSAEERAALGDSTRHLALGCPRAALLLDALARAYGAAVGWRIEPARACQHLLAEVGAAMVTGYQGGRGRGAEPFRVLVTAAAHALTSRWQRDTWEDGQVTFGVAAMYADVVLELCSVARSSRRRALRREAMQVLWFGPRNDDSEGPLAEWVGVCMGQERRGR